MDLGVIEERARSIVAACATPGAGDVAVIQRNQTSVSVKFADERLDLDPTDPPLPVQFAFLKSRVASITRIRRVNAMLTAADISPGTFPLWTLCALRPIAEWVAWAGVEKELLPHARWAQKDRKSKLVVADRVTVFAHVGSRNMALHAGLYGGALTGSLMLANKPRCYFTDRPHPHIIVEATTLPETLIVEIEERSSSRNSPVRLSDVITHPFLSAYDPLISGVANRGAGVVISFDCDFTTLQPVPEDAMRAVPIDAKPARPWDLTPAERARLREL